MVFEITVTDADGRSAKLVLAWYSFAQRKDICWPGARTWHWSTLSWSHDPDECVNSEDVGAWRAVDPHTVGRSGSGTFRRYVGGDIRLFETTQYDRHTGPGKPTVKDVIDEEVLLMRWAQSFPLRLGDHGPAWNPVPGNRINDGDDLGWQCTNLM